ncbi:MAG TPA: ABC transporter permease subunit [Acidimicrobiales bacterium]|nr:ABC transporter permease subunit [Acidimicrobiales bacterium]
MATEAAAVLAPPRAPAPAGRAPATVVARLTAKKAARSGALWGYFFGFCVAASALTYASSYKTVAARAKLAAAFGSNAAIDALFGPAHDLQTVAGYTSYKCLGFLSIVGAIWGTLMGTRLLRGEEDAGRWELLLAGQTTRRRAAVQALVGLACGFVVLFVVTALITVATGRSSKVHFALGAAVFFALALVCSAAVFLAVGALASQLAATRRQAAGYAAGAFGACYALRLVADSGAGLDWLRWATPLGWVEQLQPLTGSDALPLLPLAALVVVLASLSVHLAGTRDLGASKFPDRSSAPPHDRLLNGSAGLTARLTRSTAIAWWAGLAVMALLFGFIAKPAGVALLSSNSVERVLSRLGAPGAGADAYLGVAFLIMAMMLAFVAAGQVIGARSEEAEGRLDHLLVRPLSRWSWLGGRLSEAAAVVVIGGLAAGVFAWLGAATDHTGLRFTSLLGAGLNIVPPALCVLGVGALVIGLWPRATSIATYGVIVWSVLVEVLGGVANYNHWLLDTSLFHQMAPAPASAPNWTVGAIVVALGVAAAAFGLMAFRHRDLVGE